MFSKRIVFLTGFDTDEIQFWIFYNFCKDLKHNILLYYYYILLNNSRAPDI